MKKHGAPPWTAIEECDNSITIRDAHGDEIARVYNDDLGAVTPEQRAVGRLIAFAPKMLALLRDWIETVDAHVRDERDDIIEDATTLASAAHALLAKIDGAV